MPPRAAVLYMTVGALECAAACGAAPQLRSEIEGATALLERLVEAWGPDAEPDSLAKAIAHSLEGTLPVIHGAGPTTAVARRWATQLNENAKAGRLRLRAPRGGSQRGLRLGARAADRAAGAASSSRTRTTIRACAGAMELTAEEVERAGATAVRVTSRGESRLERVLSLVLLGDLVSVYLAALDGVDPTPIEALDRIKAGLELNLDTIVVRFSAAMEGLTINQAAETTGWSPRMLRYIENAGLIEPARTPSGYRLYGAEELQRLRTLRELLAASTAPCPTSPSRSACARTRS